MIKRFTFLLALFSLLLVLQVNSQTISITPVIIDTICPGDSVRLVAHVTGFGYGTDSYTFQVVPYHTEPFVNDTAVDPDFGANTDDAFSGPYPIGFEFCFLNQHYTQYWVGSNGWISFTQPLSSWTNYTPDTLPNGTANCPKNVIFGPWQDWWPHHSPPGVNNVFRHIETDTADSKLVVYWNNCPMYNCYGTGGPAGTIAPTGTFQIVLHQQSSIIENNITNKDLCSWQNNSATQGVQNLNGTLAYIAFNRNQNSWTAYNESTRFVPSGISWYKDAYPGGTMVGQGDSVLLFPLATATYYAVINTCINGTAAATRKIITFPQNIPSITGNNNVCLNDTVTYKTLTGMSGYTWALANGTIIGGGSATDDSITVKWDSPNPPNRVAVSYTDLNGCRPLIPTVVNITVNQFITPIITGSNSVCAGAQATYTVQAGNTNYLWTYPGATLISGGTLNDNTITLSWPSTGSKTLSVNYTGPGGCKFNTPTTKSITVNPLPVPAFTGPATACLGITNIYTTDAGMTGYIWTISAGGTLISGQGSNTVSITWNVLGAQSVNVAYTDLNGCSTNNPPPYNITVIPLPVPTIAGNASLCAESTSNTFTTEAGMTGYSWTITPDGNITSGSGTSAIQVTWPTAGLKTVSVNYVDLAGCTAASFATYNVTVNGLPSPSINGNTSMCEGTTGMVYTAQPGMSNYTWTVSAGGTITAGGTATDSTATITWNTAGAQSVSVNYSDANGCRAAAPMSYPVNVLPLPAPTVGGPAGFCVGVPGAVYNTQAGMTSYQWVISAGGIITSGGSSTDNSVTVTWNTAGAQTVSVNYSDANGCTAVSSFTYNVMVNALPVPTMTGSATVCAGTTGVVYTTQAGMINYSWIVSAGGTITSGGTATDPSVSVTWNTPGAQSVTINYNDPIGCTSVSAFVFPVTVNPLPVPTLTGNNNLCAGTTGVVYSTQEGMNNYSWAISAGGTITAGGTATDNTATVTWNNAGAQSVSVNYSDANNCTATAPVSYPVTILPLPSPTVAGPAAFCIGVPGAVYNTQAGMTNYQWVISSGGTVTAGGANTDNSVTVTWNTAGAQSVTINYHDANGCTAASSFVYNVTVNALPVPTLTGPVSVCAGATGVVYTTQAGMINYSWIVSAGGAITSGGTTSDPTVTVTWNTPGAQSVTINYNDPIGCTAVSAFVLLVTIHSLPAPIITGNNNLCEGTTGVVYSTQAGMTNYSWFVSAGGTITGGGSATDNTVTVTWNTAGLQSVGVNYNDANSCTAASPVSYAVTVHSLPSPTMAGPVLVCSGIAGSVYTTQAGMTGYQWVVSAGGTITAGGTATNNSVTVTWNSAGAQTVSINYLDANSCNAVSPVVYNVTVNPLPVVSIAGTGIVCEGTTGAVYTTQAGMNNYSWTVSAGGTITSGGTITDPAVTITWNTAGAQSVSVNYNDSFGCTATAPFVLPVTVNSLPVPTIAGNNNLCAGSTGNIYSTQAGMNNYFWTVSAGGTITAGGTINSSTATVTWNTAGAQTVSVNYHDANTCTAIVPAVFPVTVHPLPVPIIAGTNLLCAGTSGVVYSTQAGMTNYLWTVSAGGTITAGGNLTSNTATVTWNTPGAQGVSVNFQDGFSCTALIPVSYPVTVNPLPVPGISGPAGVCLNSSSIYLTDAGMTNYTWLVSPGGIITAGTGTNSITVLWNTTGAKTITVNYSDANTCSAASPSTYGVNVSNLPVPSLTGSGTVCNGISVIYSTDAGMTGYSWIVSAGGTITAGGTATDNTATVTWNTFGAQSISVNYQMGPGCTAALPTVRSITVEPRPSITNAANSSVCSATTLAIIPQADLPGTNFSWTATGSSGNVSGYFPGGGTIINDHLVNAGFNIETVTYSVTPSFNGCDGNSSSYIVTVNPVADVIFTPNGQTFCSGGFTGIGLGSQVALPSFTWTATGSSGNITGFGSGAGNTISQQLTNTGFVNETATYHVLPSINSCPGTLNNVVITVLPLPPTVFPPCPDITTTTDAKPFTLKGGTPLGGVYSGPGVNAGIFYPTLAGPGTSTLLYSYINVNGCAKTASLNLSVIGAPGFTCDNMFTDVRDNAQYPTVKIGTQCWMAANLNYGNVIPSTSMQRDNCLAEKYCFNDNVANCSSQGGLYQWDKMMQFDGTEGNQGLCPPAWHVPTENEWTTLFNFYTSNGFAGSPLKYSGFSGFNALLMGIRFDNRNWFFSNFATFIWSSTSQGPTKAWAHAMNSINPSVSYYPANRSNAFSVRCIKD
jgi:uncharacterized protein (TIGR02145 family)